MWPVPLTNGNLPKRIAPIVRLAHSGGKLTTTTAMTVRVCGGTSTFLLFAWNRRKPVSEPGSRSRPVRPTAVLPLCRLIARRPRR
jgi:hypothetical protein